MRRGPDDVGAATDLRDARHRLSVVHLRRLAWLFSTWPIATLFLALVAWDACEAPRLLWAVSASTGLAVAVALSARRASRSGHVDRAGFWYWFTCALLIPSGITMALIPMAMYSPSAPQYLYLGQVWAEAALALVVAFTAPPPAPFAALVLPALSVNALVTAHIDPERPFVHPLLSLAYLALLMIAGRQSYHQSLDALASELAYRRVAGDLSEVNDQLARTNAQLVSTNEKLESTNEKLESANEELQWRATHDLLTELPNRSAFLEAAERAVRAARLGGWLCAIILVDVDRFKAINDTLGHGAGDDALRHVATQIRAAVDDGMAARLGGDEFGVLLPDVPDVRAARAVAQRIRRQASAPWPVGGNRFTGTVSIGVAATTDPDDGVRELIHHADVALYQVKAAGRDGVAFFDEESRQALARRIQDELELRDALETGEIVTWYQPIVDLADGRIVGAEALARWIHPSAGVIPTERFLPLLEESGLLTTMCHITGSEAFRFRKEIESLVPDDFRIGINLDLRRYSAQVVVDQLIHQARTHRLSPGAITLEITEQAALSDIEETARVLAAARRHGFTTALDDFGSGWSPITLLERLELDYLKIDRGFISRNAVHPSGSAATMTAAVLELTRRLDLNVVAEGIESGDVAERLLAGGARYGQGFWYCPAVPPEQLIPLLGDRLPNGDTPKPDVLSAVPAQKTAQKTAPESAQESARKTRTGEVTAGGEAPRTGPSRSPVPLGPAGP